MEEAESGRAADAEAVELERLGLYDPAGPDAVERLNLLGQALSLGASTSELRRSTDLLGELILDLKLRPRLDASLAEVVVEAGLEPARAERLLSALGLPTDPDARLTADEVVAVRLLAGAVSQLLGFDATVQLARAAGSAMARVAEAVVTAIRLRFELPRRDSGTPYEEVVREYSALAETVLPDFVRTLDAALRHQIVRVAERMWSTDTERSAVVLPRTVGFADLVGYTARAATLSARELTAVLMEFDEITSELVLGGGGQIVKMIGDEAMFVTDDAASACRIAERLVTTFGQGSLPPVRVGLASGQVVSVFGDIYGPEVNLAARLVDAADPSGVLVSESVAAACGSDFTFEAVVPLNLRGLAAPVHAARLEPRRPAGP